MAAQPNPGRAGHKARRPDAAFRRWNTPSRARRSRPASRPVGHGLRYPGGVMFGLLEIVTVWAVIGGGVAAALRRRRPPPTVRGAPRVAIADAGEGRITCVVGELVDDQLLTAPITGRRCAHWTVEVALQPGAGDEQWATAWGGGAAAAATYRVREGALGLEDVIAVVGMGVREPDLDAARGPRLYRDGPPTRLHLSSTPTHRLFVTDAPAATGR